MTRHYSPAVLSAVVLVFVVAVPHVATAQAEAAIRPLPIEKWCAAEKALDLDAKMALFSSDIVFLSPGAPPVVGKDNVRAFHETGWKTSQVVQCTGTVDEVKVLGDWGFVRGTFSGQSKSADGSVTPYSGKYINVVRQEDGHWKIARVIWNNDGRP
jgi:uncharacterized protein (TIGR02246 family)